MKAIKFTETEVLETEGVFEFSDGNVTINEREIHEFVRLNPEPTGLIVGTTRLIVGDAIERTRDFVAKARAEIGELNSVLQELRAR